MSRRGSATGALGAAAALVALLVAAPRAAEPPREEAAVLLFPVASASPDRAGFARDLGAWLEERIGRLAALRAVAGGEREEAVRALARRETVTPEELAAICRAAGADLCLLAGCAFPDDGVVLEVRVLDVDAGRELDAFRGEAPSDRELAAAAAAVRHVAAAAGRALGPGEEERLEAAARTTLAAWAAVRAGVREADPQRREAALRRALELDPRSVDALVRLAVESYRRGDLAAALELSERAAAAGPAVPEALNNLGVVLAASGSPDRAQARFERALELAPGYAEARLNLARVLEDRGRLDAAEKRYRELLAADPANARARAGLAALHDRAGRPEEAVREFRALSATRPDLAEGEFLRAGQQARKEQAYARAERYFRRAVEINPQFADGWAELGTNSYLAGDFPGSATSFRKALAIDPQRGDVHYFLGLALEKDRRRDEALESFRRAVELGGPPGARLALARAALAGGEPERAAEQLNRLLAEHPDDAEAKLLLAEATAALEARRRVIEGQSRLAGDRLERLEGIIGDLTRTNRDLEARLLGISQDKRRLEEGLAREQERAERLRGEIARAVEEAVATLRAAPPPPAAAAAEPPGQVAELGRGTGEGEQQRARLAGLQADQARLEAELAQALEARERAERELAVEREGRRQDLERLRAAREAASRALEERDGRAAAAAELRGQVAALQAGSDAARRELAAGRERDGRELERLRGELAKAQGALADLERELVAERERGAAELERLRGELGAAASGMRGLEEEVAARRGRLAGLEGELVQARQAAEQARAASRDLEARLAAAELEFYRRVEELAKRGEAERAARGEELAAAREGARRLEAELAQARVDLAALRERAAALEAQAAEAAAGRRALAEARATVRDLALDLGRAHLRERDWAAARGSFERVVDIDPRSAEAWYGLGEALYQLGEYERSRRMYERAREIY